VDETENNLYTTQMPGMPPFYPPVVIGSGSQQWKKSPSMTAQAQKIQGVETDGQRTTGLHRIAINSSGELEPRSYDKGL